MIRFTEPSTSLDELEYLKQVLLSDKHSGGGDFTRKAQRIIEERYSFKKVLLTQSCTAALEMASVLIGIKPGDEVILPSYTFVSTANAFAVHGAKIILCDSTPNHPNMDIESVKGLITSKTKAIVCVHYGGVACDLDSLSKICKSKNIFLIEDAAQAIEVPFKDSHLGGIGDIGCFSFHDTKNISTGEGGAIVINNEDLFERSEIVWEKGTNRSSFFRGEVDKYGWVDLGSSYLPSEFTAALLCSQMDKVDNILNKRKLLWSKYKEQLEDSELYSTPLIEDIHNAHIFYLLLRNKEERNSLMEYLRAQNIYAVFHYSCLHLSLYYVKEYGEISLPNAEKFSDCLLRLPLHHNLEIADVNYICEAVLNWESGKS